MDESREELLLLLEISELLLENLELLLLVLLLLGERRWRFLPLLLLYASLPCLR